MRIALISDIHGNAVAFDAVLEDLAARPVDRVVCLGDAIQGGPQPAEVMARLVALGCPVVMGNADDWLRTGVRTDHEPIEPERLKQMEEVRAWSLARLGAADRAALAAFTPTVALALPGGRRLLAFHGTPANYDDILWPSASDEEFRRLLGDADAHVLAGGHTHLQQIRRLGAGFFCNPGSVGMVYDFRVPGPGARAYARAEYAVLTAEEGRESLEFRRVPYALDALLGAFRESGRPHAEVAMRQYTD